MKKISKLKIKEYLNGEHFREVIVDDHERETIQASIIYGMFALVAFGMSVINVITARIPLLISTSAFFALCLVNFILAQRSRKGLRIANNLFMIEVVFLFTFFIVTGGTDNFSVIWLLLLPTVGLFFFGIKKGTIMCAIIMAIMLVCFNVPYFMQYCTDYGDSFRLRFPAVFLSAYLIGFFLEYIRITTAQELNKLRYRFEYQSSHDALTGLLNRHGEVKSLKNAELLNTDEICVAMLDIDHFKVINDTYGHSNGDLILKQLSNLVLSVKTENSVFFRWGGEEFLITYYDFEEAKANVETIISAVRDTEFLISDNRRIKLTVSIGLSEMHKAKDIDDYRKIMSMADDCLYEAKESGRDRIVVEKKQ